jgi:AmmeMemoRadiSam system protein A
MSYDHALSDDEKVELLRIARATLREFVRSGRIPPGAPHRESLLAPAGVFVTLHQGADLRGCIGTQLESTPLYRVIQEMTVAAATRDPRFEPVGLDNTEDLSIEISVLGGRRRVRQPEEIEIGIDGVCIDVGGQHGLLLPQVAVEAGWDARAFLENLCIKASLDARAWQRDDAVVEAFTAQVFREP